MNEEAEWRFDAGEKKPVASGENDPQENPHFDEIFEYFSSIGKVLGTALVASQPDIKIQLMINKNK